MRYSLIVGRFQPLHSGHVKLIRTILNEGKNVLIFLKDTGKNENNPYNIEERINMFEKEFAKEVCAKRLIIHFILDLDIEEICYGRKVGYAIREIRLDKKIENINATEIRTGGFYDPEI